jgi:probable addiction module antidote protein
MSIGLIIGGIMVKKKNYRQDRMERLKDPDEAVEYLKACLEETDMPELFLVALRDVAEARGISRLARDAHLNRENLYKILSKEGNPKFESLYAILDALGLKLSVEMKSAS